LKTDRATGVHCSKRRHAVIGAVRRSQEIPSPPRRVVTKWPV
jgi:hypothetical protein